MADEPTPPDTRINLGVALGAAESSAQCFSVYIPNKDKDGKEIGNQRKWVLEAIELFTAMNGGATAMPPVEGAWVGDGGVVWESPVVVYSFIRPAAFVANLPRIREFVHRLGRETNQGEVACEFEDRFYLIRKYDPA